LGTPKNCNSPLSLRNWSHKGWVWFFVRIFEIVTKENRCVVFLSFVLSNGMMVSRKLDHVVCVGWRIYNIICKLGLEFLWKSNVVLDLCGFEDFEKRAQWVQKSEIRAIWSFENLKLFYDEKDDFFASFWTELRWP